MHGDGGNLWLQVTGDANRPARSWLFRFGRNGRERYMGLGPYPDVGLQEARDKAQDARRLLRDGKDPIEVKRSGEAAAALTAAQRMTFRQCAEAYIERIELVGRIRNMPRNGLRRWSCTPIPYSATCKCRRST